MAKYHVADQIKKFDRQLLDYCDLPNDLHLQVCLCKLVNHDHRPGTCYACTVAQVYLESKG